jgi:uncharacterized protein (DUF486 family)
MRLWPSGSDAHILRHLTAPALLLRDRDLWFEPPRGGGETCLPWRGFPTSLLIKTSLVQPIKPGVPMPAMLTSSSVLPILMLIGSNVFMTFAWYGHLRFKAAPLLVVIIASWGIAFVEYCLAVPANRWGNAVYSTAQLKTIQEIITLLIFAAFSVFFLKEPLTWNYAIGFVLVGAGAFFIFRGPF